MNLLRHSTFHIHSLFRRESYAISQKCLIQSVKFTEFQIIGKTWGIVSEDFINRAVSINQEMKGLVLEQVFLVPFSLSYNCLFLVYVYS
jgi:hypothetical protein